MDHLFVLFDLCKRFLGEQVPRLSNHCIRYNLLLFRQLYYPAGECIHLVVRFKHLKHVPEVLTLHDLVLQDLYKAQAH